MKYVQRVLFVIGFVFLSIHCVRLTFELWLEPRTSVLDKYAEPVEVDIRNAGSLDDLVARYDTAYKQVKAFEADKSHPAIEAGERYETEPYKSEQKLHGAIEEWEQHAREISKIRTYWAFGLLFLLIGAAADRGLNPWLGLAAFVVAFSEMIYWSSPTYFGTASEEFRRLLVNRLTLAVVSFMLLLLVGRFIGMLARERPQG